MVQHIDISGFCQKQKHLLEQEFQHDSSKSATPPPSAKHGALPANEEGRRTKVLRKLEASEMSVGLYGRTVVQFRHQDDNNNRLLPGHKFTTGDELEIRNNKSNDSKKKNPSGVVSEVTDTSISVALFPSKNDAEPNSDDDFFAHPPFSLIPMSNVQVHKKMATALSDLESHGLDHKVCGNVVRWLFSPPATKETGVSQSTSPIRPFNPNLDQSQLEAIAFALSPERPVSLIHGPVGDSIRCVGSLVLSRWPHSPVLERQQQ